MAPTRKRASVLIDEEVISKIEALEELAPLHNKSAVSIMRAARDKFDPSINQVAVFDTVFHRNIPECAKLYAIPPELSERYKIRRLMYFVIVFKSILVLIYQF